MVSSR